VLNDGKNIKYSDSQSRLITSEANARMKIRGLAGSGKTTVLAKRAVNAHKRHGDRVLILTFNLTLGMYIHDKISEVREEFSWGAFQINNYHKFMNQMLNRLGIKIEVKDDNSSDDFLDRNYYSNEDVFSSCEISDSDKYQTILIDEVQDYKPSWVKIIRSYFLAEQGEMVLFGDEKQNIYKREMEEDKTIRTPYGFKPWKKLTNKSFRNTEHSIILSLATDFKAKYFSGVYESDFETESDDSFQPQLSDLGLSQCVNYEENDLEPLVDYVFKAARRDKIHPNEIVIIGSKIALLQEIDFLIRTSEKFNERTLTTFESKEDLKGRSQEEQKKIRGKKKTGFNLNSGVIKISTIHSFKGYESPTVFLIIDDVDSPELVYVGLTRAKINLVVFVKKKSKYEDFFIKSLGVAACI
jgi:superfamily I DNA/RNA helicase